MADNRTAPSSTGTEEDGKPPSSFRALLVEIELSQSEFALLGGWLPSSVNRWCQQRPTDARPIPRHAWALASAYRLLSPRQRMTLLDLAGAKSKRAAPAKPGPQDASEDTTMPRPKIATNLRLDAEVVEAFKVTGPKWQARINAALRAYLRLDGSRSTTGR